MITDVFVTKLGMTQAWTTKGRRVAVTRCSSLDNMVVGQHTAMVVDKNTSNRARVATTILEVGYGDKKLKNMDKPLRSRLEKSGFSMGVRAITGVRVAADQEGESVPTIGQTINPATLLEVGDVVTVQGVTKGRGFAGVVKRHGFHGGPKTHGQSDRHRAPGSIAAGTTPGRVYKGKRMAGHYGVETMSISGLVVLHVDQTSGEIWLSGPVPGAIFSSLRITKTGAKKPVELNKAASGIKQSAPVAVAPAATEVAEATEPDAPTAEEIKE